MRRSSLLAVLALLTIAVTTLAGCSKTDDRCRQLVSSAGGPTRAEYLSCVGRMLAAMDAIDQERPRSQKGDLFAHLRMLGACSRLGGMIRSAGGRRLLDRWDDPALSQLNVALWNAYAHYRATALFPDVEEAAVAAREKERARALYAALLPGSPVRAGAPPGG